MRWDRVALLAKVRFRGLVCICCDCIFLFVFVRMTVCLPFFPFLHTQYLRGEWWPIAQRGLTSYGIPPPLGRLSSACREGRRAISMTWKPVRRGRYNSGDPKWLYHQNRELSKVTTPVLNPFMCCPSALAVTLSPTNQLHHSLNLRATEKDIWRQFHRVWSFLLYDVFEMRRGRSVLATASRRGTGQEQSKITTKRV